jgi:hypothetical protein
LLKGAGRRSNLSGSGIQTLCGKALMNYLSRR